jgi:hypothetical protein
MMLHIFALGCAAFVSQHLEGGLPSGATAAYTLEVRRPLTDVSRAVGTMALDYQPYPTVAGTLETGDGAIQLGLAANQRDALRLSTPEGQAENVGCVGPNLVYAAFGDALFILELMP